MNYQKRHRFLKPPPFSSDIVDNLKKLVLNFHRADAKPDSFVVKNEGQYHKVTVDTPQTYRLIQKYLEETEIEFFTYSLKNEKAFWAVLKGADNSYSADEELARIGFEVRSVYFLCLSLRQNHQTHGLCETAAILFMWFIYFIYSIFYLMFLCLFIVKNYSIIFIDFWMSPKPLNVRIFLFFYIKRKGSVCT